MALGNNSIDFLEKCMSASDHNVKRFYTDLEAAINKLHNNDNYNTFIANTDIGKSIDERILKLRGIGKSTGSDVEKLIKKTNTFLDNQKRYNNMINKVNNVASATPKNEGIGAPSGPNAGIGIDYASDPRFTAPGGGH